MESIAVDRPPAPQPPPTVRPVAVIDIGSTLIRMAVAEIDERGGVRTLDSMSQAVPLGKDTFTTGAIQKSTIEDCVRVLKSYRQILEEYQITRPEQIRAVATSAVREASNRLAFLDRVYIATGIEIEPLDEAEVSRVTYLGIQPLLQTEPALASAPTLIIEVGGGSTEVLLVQNNDVLHSHTYKLGSLRLRESLEASRAPRVKTRKIMENQIRQTIEQIIQHAPHDGQCELIALGSDVRFAATRLSGELTPGRLARLSVPALEKIADEVLGFSEDQIAQKYKLNFADAETLGPALLVYIGIARALKLKQFYVTRVNLRDGLLQDLAAKGKWTDEFNNRIIRSALELGRKFTFNESHAVHVANLSRMLFKALTGEHGLGPRHGLLVYVAALLHEIGLFVNNTSYHKHSMYLINNSELFGLSRQDVLLVSLIARYHRRASPKSIHPGYASLDRENRIAVAKLAAILRVADALDHSHSQRIQELRCERTDDRLIISVPYVQDLALEQLALKQKGPLFEETCGMPVLLRRST
jgi:exopolyphosphatase/guanosine-5'-triphosphate,3'-diphosphate pyrophosphatase